MEKLLKIALLALAFSALAIALSFFTNNPVSATSHANATTNRPGPTITPVRDEDSPGRHPFAISATCTSSNDSGCVATPIFPTTTSDGAAVKTVVTDFVSGLCTGLAPGITQDTFSFVFFLGGQASEAFYAALVDPGGTGRFSLQSTIYADPGSTGTFGTPGNNSGCTISITGHLIPL
jgi:hypothetical protein